MSAKTTKKNNPTKTEKVNEDSPKKKVQAASTGGKKKLVVSYKNLSTELQELIKEKYPKGYGDSVIKVDKGNGDFFYAITLDTEEASYLVKVDVKIDTEIEEVERQLFGGNSEPDSGEVGDEFPDAEEEGGGFESEAPADDED